MSTFNPIPAPANNQQSLQQYLQQSFSIARSKLELLMQAFWVSGKQGELEQARSENSHFSTLQEQALDLQFEDRVDPSLYSVIFPVNVLSVNTGHIENL
ncbi:hypothetical protein [Leptolyngbya sp. FACHB-261]|uniref:hypothetical protein n=1 Tax=Leptolyngbya sp. FACHB-261 TaxID=2692806 RepID=UPI001687FCCA|nr:hypothetical protein [Leptolyngbya sp. FACHB-261]MBD2103057.1 hypothetical protein [Leptolyngbya sp. FACHB-261]